MANEAKTLYVGSTNNLAARVQQHKEGTAASFTGRYRLTKLVYVEEAMTPYEAVSRERQLKGWLRRRKVELIESVNPEWDDLSAGWLGLTGAPLTPRRGALPRRPDPSLRSG